MKLHFPTLIPSLCFCSFDFLNVFTQPSVCISLNAFFSVSVHICLKSQFSPCPNLFTLTYIVSGAAWWLSGLHCLLWVSVSWLEPFCVGVCMFTLCLDAPASFHSPKSFRLIATLNRMVVCLTLLALWWTWFPLYPTSYPSVSWDDSAPCDPANNKQQWKLDGWVYCQFVLPFCSFSYSFGCPLLSMVFRFFIFICCWQGNA